jgi:hypothetical protein
LSSIAGKLHKLGSPLSKYQGGGEAVYGFFSPFFMISKKIMISVSLIAGIAVVLLLLSLSGDPEVNGDGRDGLNQIRSVKNELSSPPGSKVAERCVPRSTLELQGKAMNVSSYQSGSSNDNGHPMPELRKSFHGDRTAPLIVENKGRSDVNNASPYSGNTAGSHPPIQAPLVSDVNNASPYSGNTAGSHPPIQAPLVSDVNNASPYAGNTAGSHPPIQAPLVSDVNNASPHSEDTAGSHPPIQAPLVYYADYSNPEMASETAQTFEQIAKEFVDDVQAGPPPSDTGAYYNKWYRAVAAANDALYTRVGHKVFSDLQISSMDKQITDSISPTP